MLELGPSEILFRYKTLSTYRMYINVIHSYYVRYVLPLIAHVIQGCNEEQYNDTHHEDPARSQIILTYLVQKGE
jgi:hypothetical protein